MEYQAATEGFYHCKQSKKRNGESYVSRANPKAMDRFAGSTSNRFQQNPEINAPSAIAQASRPPRRAFELPRLLGVNSRGSIGRFW
jgi:hypothetical protein